MVLSLGGEEEGCFQNRGWVVGHEGVGDIEAFEVLNCCCLPYTRPISISVCGKGKHLGIVGWRGRTLTSVGTLRWSPRSRVWRQ